MIAVRRLANRPTKSGQILVLTALMMVILIGMAALAIDVSAAYLTERWERSVADEAALSGAQSLQKPGTRSLPEDAEYEQARINAMRVLEAQLGGTPGSGDCYSSAGCELSGTPYLVSVQTPSPSCVDCDVRRAVQVSIWQPEFGLTFGRIFGESTWTVRSTSVAGMVVAPQYGLVTLRPSSLRKNGSDENYDDLSVTGGSKVIVGNADIATNSNAVCSGFEAGSEIRIDDPLNQGFDLHHYGEGAAWIDPPGRCFNPPGGFQVTTLVADPGYTIPSRTGSTPYPDQAAGEADPAICEAQQLLVPDTYRELKTNAQINDPLQVTVSCLNQGTYATKVTVQDPASGLPNVLLLLPGVYFFDGGLEVSSTVIGGYVPSSVPSSSGVALVFPQAGAGAPGQFLTKTSTSLVALNYGDKYCPDATCTGGTWANPAEGPDGPVQTPEPHPTLLTLMVQPNPQCAVEAPPSADCKKNENQTLQLQGGGNIYLAGVQYAPSDNAVLTGSSGQSSDVGAFWAWTLEFNGGTNFNLTSANPQSAGVLRIDPACSPNVSTCNP